jgi:uncharacterized protein (TIRG00374 family)
MDRRRHRWSTSAVVRIGTALTIVAIAAVFYRQATTTTIVGDTLGAIQQIGLPTILAVLALSLTNYVARFLRWTMYIGEPAARLSPIRHLAIYLAGFALTATPSKSGEAVRSIYLKPMGISYERSLAALLAERLTDFVVISAMAILILFQQASVVRWLGLVGLGLALTLLALQHPTILGLVERLVQRIPVPLIRKAAGHALSLLHAVRAHMRPGMLLPALGLGTIAWVAEGIGLYLILQRLGVDLGVVPSIGIYATAVVAGAVTFLPGGLGSTELVMITLLTSVGAAGSTAIAATACIRLATLWFAVAIGAGAWLAIESIYGATNFLWGRGRSQ